MLRERERERERGTRALGNTWSWRLEDVPKGSGMSPSLSALRVDTCPSRGSGLWEGTMRAVAWKQALARTSTNYSSGKRPSGLLMFLDEDMRPCQRERERERGREWAAHRDS